MILREFKPLFTQWTVTKVENDTGTVPSSLKSLSDAFLVKHVPTLCSDTWSCLKRLGETHIAVIVTVTLESMFWFDAFFF